MLCLRCIVHLVSSSHLILNILNTILDSVDTSGSVDALKSVSLVQGLTQGTMQWNDPKGGWKLSLRKKVTAVLRDSSLTDATGFFLKLRKFWMEPGDEISESIQPKEQILIITRNMREKSEGEIFRGKNKTKAKNNTLLWICSILDSCATDTGESNPFLSGSRAGVCVNTPVAHLAFCSVKREIIKKSKNLSAHLSFKYPSGDYYSKMP